MSVESLYRKRNDNYPSPEWLWGGLLREWFPRGENKRLDQLKQRLADAILVLNKTDWQKEIAEVT